MMMPTMRTLGEEHLPDGRVLWQCASCLGKLDARFSNAHPKSKTCARATASRMMFRRGFAPASVYFHHLDRAGVHFEMSTMTAQKPERWAPQWAVAIAASAHEGAMASGDVRLRMKMKNRVASVLERMKDFGSTDERAAILALGRLGGAEAICRLFKFPFVPGKPFFNEPLWWLEQASAA